MTLGQRIAFSIFGVDIYWYGIFMALGIFACVIFAVIYCKLKKIDTSTPIEIFLAIVPLGILSARLFSVIFEPGLTIADYFNFRSGGMSIMGAIIGGSVGAAIWVLAKKRNFLWAADIITCVLPLGQAIGRWGNYFNQELFGKIITNPSWQFFPFAVNIDGNWYMALFFYESVLNFIAFVALSAIFLKTKKVGLTTGIYLIYYGTIRLILENLRQSEYVLMWGKMQVSSLISGLLLAAGVAIICGIIIKYALSKKEVKNA